MPTFPSIMIAAAAKPVIREICAFQFSTGSISRNSRRHRPSTTSTSWAGIGSEIPRLLLEGRDEEALRAVRWYLEVFGDRFYFEIQDHGLPEERRAYARIEDGRVIFKAELAVVTHRTAQVQGVWVDPAWRGQGLATAAMVTVLQDALARVAPTVMIMCPCEGGLSHNEAEAITPDWARAGCDVLLHAVLETAGIAP